MSGPGWLAPGLAALLMLITVVCVGRLARWRRRRPAEPDVDALHAVMGVVMAGMLLPGLSFLPDRIWQRLFAVAAAWFAAQAIGSRLWAAQGRPFSRLAPHVIECAAMIYMLAPARSTSSGRMAMAGMTALPAANPVVTLLFAATLLGYLLWTTDQLTATRHSAPIDGHRQDRHEHGHGLHAPHHALTPSWSRRDLPFGGDLGRRFARP